LGPVEESLDAPCGPLIELISKEHREELGVGEIIRFGFHDTGLEMFADTGKLEGAELLYDITVRHEEFLSLLLLMK